MTKLDNNCILWQPLLSDPQSTFLSSAVASPLSPPHLAPSHPPVAAALKQEQFRIPALTGSKSFYQECILMDNMLHLSHQNLNCIIFNFFLPAQNQSFLLRAVSIRVVEELVLRN